MVGEMSNGWLKRAPSDSVDMDGQGQPAARVRWETL